MKIICACFLLLCCFSPILGWLHRCPPPENMPKWCNCQRIDSEVNVKCRNFSDTHELSEAISSFQDYVLDALVLANSRNIHMVPGIFRKVHVHRLMFLNVSFDILSMLTSLKGTEKFLEELTFEKCTVNKWIWSGGTYFSFLKILTIRNTELPKDLLPGYFNKFPSKIEQLIMKGCGVKTLQQFALKRLSSLKQLKLENNQLHSIARNSLAPSLQRLIVLSLRGNPLEDLPDDMFTSMPRLETLYLGETLLKALRWKTFQPVWQQLEQVFFNRIRLHCDCDIAWLIDIDKSKMPIDPFCSQFEKPIRKLTHTELCPVRR